MFHHLHLDLLHTRTWLVAQVASLLQWVELHSKPPAIGCAVLLQSFGAKTGRRRSCSTFDRISNFSLNNDKYNLKAKTKQTNYV